MFQLIVTVLSIALVAALALAAVFYGGGAFTNASLGASTSALISQGNQIAFAMTQHKLNNPNATGVTVANLVSGGYLATVPTAPSQLARADRPWIAQMPAGRFISVGLRDAAVCAEVYRQRGVVPTPTIPQISDTSTTDQIMDTLGGGPFGCVNSQSDGSYSFIIRVN